MASTDSPQKLGIASVLSLDKLRISPIQLIFTVKIAFYVAHFEPSVLLYTTPRYKRTFVLYVRSVVVVNERGDLYSVFPCEFDEPRIYIEEYTRYSHKT